MDDVKFSPNSKGNVIIHGDLGLPKKPPRSLRNRLTSQATKEQAAALKLAGVGDASIAKQLGISTRHARALVQDARENGMMERQKAALEEHFHPAKEVAEKMIKAMDKGANLYDKFAGTEFYERGPTLREVAYTYSVLAEHVLYPNADHPPEVSRTRLNIDLKDPAAVRELFAIMRGDEKPAIDVTPAKKET
jgi:hypothetical protein